jgi:hypothetical protein
MRCGMHPGRGRAGQSAARQAGRQAGRQGAARQVAPPALDVIIISSRAALLRSSRRDATAAASPAAAAACPLPPTVPPHLLPQILCMTIPAISLSPPPPATPPACPCTMHPPAGLACLCSSSGASCCENPPLSALLRPLPPPCAWLQVWPVRALHPGGGGSRELLHMGHLGQRQKEVRLCTAAGQCGDRAALALPGGLLRGDVG